MSFLVTLGRYTNFLEKCKYMPVNCCCVNTHQNFEIIRSFIAHNSSLLQAGNISILLQPVFQPVRESILL